MSNNVNVLLIGAGRMAEFYCEVFKGMNIVPMIVGRGSANAKALTEKTGFEVLEGGIEKAYDLLPYEPTHVIIATGVETLLKTTEFILKKGIKNILLEKPGALNLAELETLNNLSEQFNAQIRIAYNRRFYSSVKKAEEIIEEDGGLVSINYEFTEWSHVIKDSHQTSEVKENWLLANSTHVIDLAFYFAGAPIELSAYTKGKLDWYSKAAAFAGAGITEKDVLFTYQANWEAPGRWGLELLTKKHRLYLRPMEQLSMQDIGSVQVYPVEIEDEIDKKYKPGLYEQVESFVNLTDDERTIYLQEHVQHVKWYEAIEGVDVQN